MKVSPLITYIVTLNDLEKDLLTWFEQVRASNLPVSSNLVKQKALEITKHLVIENFSASNGWINCFHQRFNVVYKTVSSECKRISPEITKHWSYKRLFKYR